MSKPGNPSEDTSPVPACPDCNQPVWERPSPRLSAERDSKGSHGTARLTPTCKPCSAGRSMCCVQDLHQNPSQTVFPTFAGTGREQPCSSKATLALAERKAAEPQHQGGLSQRAPCPGKDAWRVHRRGLWEETCFSAPLPRSETTFGVALTSCLTPAQIPALLSPPAPPSLTLGSHLAVTGDAQSSVAPSTGDPPTSPAPKATTHSCTCRRFTARHPQPVIPSSPSQATLWGYSKAVLPHPHPRQASHPCLAVPSLPLNSHHSPGFDYGHKGALEEPQGSWREAGR